MDRRATGAAALIALVSLWAPTSAGAEASLWTVSSEGLGAGVTYHRLWGDQPVSVHVAHVAPGSGVTIEVVLSHDQVAEPTGDRREVTTSMCSRHGALACLNGDFATCPACGVPIGGVVHDRRLLRSPQLSHEQLSVLDGGGLRTDRLVVTPVLRAVYEVVPADPVSRLLTAPAREERTLPIDGVNVARPDHGIVLYDPGWAPSTQTAPGGVEAVFELAGPPIVLASVAARAVTLVDGGADTAVPANGMVLSASGAGADRLREFWAELDSRADQVVELALTLDGSLPAEESVGGHPVLLRGGQPTAIDANDPKVRNRHPRTLVGWNDAGDRWFIVVDGRSSSSRGVTLFEAQDLLRLLGATEGINLDGGGSSTFVTSTGCVGRSACIRNRPSDGRERPVTTALAVVPVEPVVLPAEPAPPPPSVAAPAPAPVPASADSPPPPAPDVLAEPAPPPTPPAPPPEPTPAPAPDDAAPAVMAVSPPAGPAPLTSAPMPTTLGPGASGELVAGAGALTLGTWCALVRQLRRSRPAERQRLVIG